MAKAARGLPENFALDLPDEKPVVIGDFLDEEPVLPPPRPRQAAQPEVRQLRPEVARIEREGEQKRPELPRPLARAAQAPSAIRYQLNLSLQSKKMLEGTVEHVRTYSAETDARTSEVFQGIMTLVYNALDELDLSELPRRGAWGSVTAKNFPNALSEAFERAILATARKQGKLP